MTDFAQLLFYGIVTGAILTLGAIGVSLIFGILRFAHFAHGDVMTMGAYLALIFTASLDWPVMAALPVAMALSALLTVLIDRLVYQRLRRTAPVILLISSFGMALLLRAVVQLIWGVDYHVYQAGISIPHVLAGIRFKTDHLWIIGSSFVLVMAFHLFLKSTRMGKAMRAMSDNVDLARVSGIDAERVVLWTWIIGGGLAGAAGVFLAMDTRLIPQLGWNVLLPVFAATIVGGIGRIYGAIAGGMLIGIVGELSTALIEPAYKPAVAFAIMVLVLVIRPQGILRGNA